MFNKNDPLIDSVTKIMEENQVRRNVTEAVNAELGIADKKALPHEHHAEYDTYLEEAIQEALKGNQHKIDANKNNKVDAHDFKLLRARKEKKPEEHGVEAEREMASKGQKMYEEEKSYSAKEARAGKDIGKKGKMFAKIAASAAKKYGSEERGKKVAGAVLAKLRAKTMKEESEESDPAPVAIQEKAPPGDKFERMVKHIKDKYKKDGLTDKEKSIAYATAWKAKNKEEKIDEQSFMDALKAVATGGGQNPSSTAPKPTTSLALGGASTQASAPPVGAGPGSRAEPRPYTGIGAMGGQGTAAAEKAKGTTSIATGGAPSQAPAMRPTTSTPVNRAGERPTPTPAPATSTAPAARSSEVVASRAANVPDSRNLRTAVKPPSGEGATGKALAAAGVSKADRLNPNFLKSQGISGKPGSAEANLALKAKMQAQRTAVANAENPKSAANAPTKPAMRPGQNVSGIKRGPTLGGGVRE